MPFDKRKSLKWEDDVDIKLRGGPLELDGSYSGQCDDEGTPNGLGRIVAKFGNIVEGQFKDGVPHGFVRAIYSDGSYDYYKEKRGNQVCLQAFDLDDNLDEEVKCLDESDHDEDFEEEVVNTKKKSYKKKK